MQNSEVATVSEQSLESVGQGNRQHARDSRQSCLVVQAKCGPRFQESQMVLEGRQCAGQPAG